MIELIRRAVEVFRKPLDGLEVVLNSGLRVVTSLELVEHRLSEMGVPAKNSIRTQIWSIYGRGVRRSRLGRGIK